MGLTIETINNPNAYSPAQLHQAATIAKLLDRQHLCLTEPPKLKP